MDASGAAIPSASVTVHNTGTNADIHLTGDTSGYFKAPLLDPGTYTVTITAQGFGTDTETNVGVVRWADHDAVAEAEGGQRVDDGERVGGRGAAEL